MKPYKNLSPDEKIERFLEAADLAYSSTDAREFWPAHAPQIEVYFNFHLASLLHRRFRGNPQRFNEALKKLTVYQVRLLLADIVITGIKAARAFESYKISDQDFLSFVEAFFSVLEERMPTDPFSLNGTYQVYTKEEIDRILSLQNWSETFLKDCIGLGLTLRAFTWARWFDLFEAGGAERIGPYKTADGLLITQRFLNFGEKPNFREINLLFLYEPASEIFFDYLNHPHEYPSPRQLKRAALLVNGQEVGAGEIVKLENYFTGRRKEIVAATEQLSPTEIIKKGVTLAYEMIKPLFDYLGEDWHPPQEVFERLEKVGLRYWNMYDFKGRDLTHPPGYYRKLLDPRNNFIE